MFEDSLNQSTHESFESFTPHLPSYLKHVGAPVTRSESPVPSLSSCHMPCAPIFEDVHVTLHNARVLIVLNDKSITTDRSCFCVLAIILSFLLSLIRKFIKIFTGLFFVPFITMPSSYLLFSCKTKKNTCMLNYYVNHRIQNTASSYSTPRPSVTILSFSFH